MRELIIQTKNRTVFTAYDQFAYTLLYITKSEFFNKSERLNLKPVFKEYGNPNSIGNLSDLLIVGIYMDWLYMSILGRPDNSVTNILYLLRVARFLTAVRKTITRAEPVYVYILIQGAS